MSDSTRREALQEGGTSRTNVTRAVVVFLMTLGVMTGGFVGLVTPVAAATTDVTTCRVIDTPGVYLVQNDLSVLQNGIILGDGTDVCIDIRSSDVVLDGQGYALTGTNLAFDPSIGVLVDGTTAGPYTNVTVRNVTTSGFTVNTFQFVETTDVRLEDVVMQGNRASFVASTDVTVTGVTLRRAAVVGLSDVDGAVITNIVEETSTSNGIVEGGGAVELRAVRNAAFADSELSLGDITASGLGGSPLDSALTVVGSDSISVRNVTVSNTLIGVDIGNNANVAFEDLSITDVQTGISVRDIAARAPSDDVTVRNIAVSNALVGVSIRNSANTTFEELSVSNAQTGISAGDDSVGESSDNVIVRNSTVVNSGFEDVRVGSNPSLFDNNSTAIAFESLELSSATVSFTGQDVRVSGVDAPPATPTDRTNVGGFFNATATSTTGLSSSLLNITVSYDDADVVATDITESTLELWQYDGTAWALVPGSTVDTTNDTVSASITDFSVFAPLGTTGPTVDVDDSGDGSNVTVTGAITDEPVTIPLDGPVTENVTLDSLAVTTTLDTTYTLNVTTGETVPPGTTDLAVAGPNGTVSFGYLTVETSLLDAEVSEVVFRFSVDVDALATAGVDPDDVALFRYDATTGTPEVLPTTNLGLNATTGAYEYEAVSPGLSVFAIGGLVPQIVVIDASVDESEVLVDDTVTVTATARNDGGTAGSETLNLTVDGVVVDSRTVTLGVGEKTTVTFDYTVTAAGTFDLAVEGVAAGTVLVKLPVEIDVQPDDTPNELPPSPRAAVPVAVLGNADFDPTTIDNSTLRFGSEATVAAGGGATAFATDVEDVNGDGYDDLVAVFRLADAGFEADDTTAVLTGRTTGGLTVYGTDSVVIR